MRLRLPHYPHRVTAKRPFQRPLRGLPSLQEFASKICFGPCSSCLVEASLRRISPIPVSGLAATPSRAASIVVIVAFLVSKTVPKFSPRVTELMRKSGLLSCEPALRTAHAHQLVPQPWCTCPNRLRSVWATQTPMSHGPFALVHSMPMSLPRRKSGMWMLSGSTKRCPSGIWQSIAWRSQKLGSY
jgi:hypothetical protein